MCLKKQIFFQNRIFPTWRLGSLRFKESKKLVPRRRGRGRDHLCPGEEEQRAETEDQSGLWSVHWGGELFSSHEDGVTHGQMMRNQQQAEHKPRQPSSVYACLNTETRSVQQTVSSVLSSHTFAAKIRSNVATSHSVHGISSHRTHAACLKMPGL